MLVPGISWGQATSALTISNASGVVLNPGVITFPNGISASNGTTGLPLADIGNVVPSILNPQFVGRSVQDTNLAWKVESDTPTVVSNWTSCELVGVGQPFHGYGHIQGIAIGTNNDIYLSFTIGIFKISNNATWSNGSGMLLLASNTTAQGTALPNQTHYGDLKFWNNQLYVSAEIYNSHHQF